MKYINRELKGTYGYLKKQLIFEIVKTLVLFAMALGIFFIGYLTLHTKRSLWSVLAVLALLPASKSLVGVIMLARFRSLTREEYELFLSSAGDIPALYEIVMTTTQRSFYIPAMIFASNTLTAYVPSSGSDMKILKEHIEHVLKGAGHSATVKLYDDRDGFCKRAAQLCEKHMSEDENRASNVFNTIKAVSL